MKWVHKVVVINVVTVCCIRPIAWSALSYIKCSDIVKSDLVFEVIKK